MNVEQNLKLAADRLKQTRIESKISIEELSKLSGLSIYKIKKIESGKYNFQLKEFNKISELLNIKLALK